MTLETENSETGSVDTGARVEIGTGASDGVEPPRRRGRPPGSGKKQAGETPNAVPGDESASGAKRGPKSRKGKKLGDDDRNALAQQIKGLHQLGAMVTGIPEFALGDQEALLLANGVIAVSQQYDLAIDGKTGALIQLAAAAAAVYVPRILHFKARANQARAAQGVTIEGEVTAP